MDLLGSSSSHSSDDLLPAVSHLNSALQLRRDSTGLRPHTTCVLITPLRLQPPAAQSNCSNSWTELLPEDQVQVDLTEVHPFFRAQEGGTHFVVCIQRSFLDVEQPGAATHLLTVELRECSGARRTEGRPELELHHFLSAGEKTRCKQVFNPYDSGSSPTLRLLSATTSAKFVTPSVTGTQQSTFPLPRICRSIQIHTELWGDTKPLWQRQRFFHIRNKLPSSIVRTQAPSRSPVRRRHVSRVQSGGLTAPEQGLKQAVTDARGLFRVVITKLMCCARSREQRGSLLGAA
ncbi:unnamed protein product [Pleuronectes platessa]|uniref:Uncharacterized protein n=1 Tax=Pleuronectes platessa TaxID=8262 RepID=A0A9N7UGF2_PLEPL|nr:unnamed protein product [Pleuronectes platessa]